MRKPYVARKLKTEAVIRAVRHFQKQGIKPTQPDILAYCKDHTMRVSDVNWVLNYDPAGQVLVHQDAVRHLSVPGRLPHWTRHLPTYRKTSPRRFAPAPVPYQMLTLHRLPESVPNWVTAGLNDTINRINIALIHLRTLTHKDDIVRSQQTVTKLINEYHDAVDYVLAN